MGDVTNNSQSRSLWQFLRCRLFGHIWEAGYRESDGYPTCYCDRCGLTEEWAGGMLVNSTNWRESLRLNAREEVANA